jgi:hypothetical protein
MARVTGFREIEKAMDGLKKSTGRAVLRRAGIKALTPIAEAGRDAAPKGQGDLKESYGVGTKLSKNQAKLHRTAVKGKKSAIEVFAGPGSLPQAIQTEFGNVTEAPRPHLRPAWDAGREKVLSDVKRELWSEIKATAARAARKAAKLAKG